MAGSTEPPGRPSGSTISRSQPKTSGEGAKESAATFIRPSSRHTVTGPLLKPGKGFGREPRITQLARMWRGHACCHPNLVGQVRPRERLERPQTRVRSKEGKTGAGAHLTQMASRGLGAGPPGPAAES